MLGFNVIAADTDDQARLLFSSAQQAFINLRSGRPGRLPPPVQGFDRRLTPVERSILESTLSASAVGSPETVSRGLTEFIERTGADELMVTAQIFDHEARLRSYEIAAEVGELTGLPSR
jgi:alkanesulfonate monooxygenase SsuD/methylene tetrahydromethanopterin reductase-like flavin-dependent oxidoreductase (luciferase family)